jgi:hypothetical protein
VGRPVARQSFDDWFARSPLIEIVFDDEQILAAFKARHGQPHH